MQANIYRIEDNEANIRKLMKDDVALRLRLGQDEARITENSVRISAQASEEDSTNDLLMRRINRIETMLRLTKWRMRLTLLSCRMRWNGLPLR